MISCYLVNFFVLWFNLSILVSSYSHFKAIHYRDYDPEHFRIPLSARKNRLMEGNSLPDIRNHNRRKSSPRVGSGNCQQNNMMVNFVVNMFDMNPDKTEDISVQYIFYSREDRTPTTVTMANQRSSKFIPLKFDRRKETVIIVHGFQSNGMARWVNDMADAILQWGDLNVIAVDWRKGGMNWQYWKAFSNAGIVGREMNEFVKFMVASAKLQPKKLHLIGHSLGAHICSFAAAGVKGIKRITGLDPSHVCIGKHYLGAKLSKSDANFVDVIHTNAGVQIHLFLGMWEPLGHADFYPNGGSLQPHCEKYSDRFTAITKAINKAICNHASAYMYFTETLRHPDCMFFAKPWHSGNNEMKPVQCEVASSPQGLMTSRPCALMGMPADIAQANGTYYVKTNNDDPWCEYVNLNEISRAAQVMKMFMNLLPNSDQKPATLLRQMKGRAEKFTRITKNSKKVH